MIIFDEKKYKIAVISAFDFLVKKMGYSVDAEASWLVIIANEHLDIRVFREPGSYMIYVEFRRKDTGEEYVLHEVLHALAPEYESRSQCSGADEEKANRCLKQLSQLCEQQLQDFLAMDESIVEKVASSAKLVRTRYTLEAQYGAIKDRADEAWKNKDWEKARQLYEEAKPGLTVAQERRLRFLLKTNARP